MQRLYSVITTPQLAHDVVTTLGFGCILVVTSDNVVTMLSQRCISDVITTTKNWRCYNVVFSTSVFQPEIKVVATSWSWCRFPDEILKVFKYHYNFLFPKIYNIALPFQFLINKIYSACVNAKRLLKWWIFENFQLVAWIEKRDFWSCVVHLSETAPCFLAVNSLGSWFNYFLHSSIQNTEV